MKRTSLVVVAAAAVVALAGTAALAGGARCQEQHAQGDYQKMAEKMAAKGWLGVETEPNSGGGYTVTAVRAGSPAAAAGFQSGDVLLALNGVRLADENKEALAKVKASLGPGKQATYTVRRAGAERTVVATLGEVPREVLAQWVGEHVLEHTTLAIAQAD